MSSKKETCIKSDDMKEEKNVERFNIFMKTALKKIDLNKKETKLEERRVELVAALKDIKMLHSFERRSHLVIPTNPDAPSCFEGCDLLISIKKGAHA